MTGRRKILLGCLGLIGLLLMGLAVAGYLVSREMRVFWTQFESFDETKEPWIQCPLPHPGGEPSVVFLQKHIHPFLAEYEYKVRFGSVESAVEGVLPINCGGRTLMNCYWYPEEAGFGPCIRMEDHWGEYLLNLKEQKTFRIVRTEDGVFIGEVTNSSGGWGTSTSTDANGKRKTSVYVGDRPATDVTATVIGQGKGSYFGRLEQQGSLMFVPTRESPERQIKKVSP